MNLHNHRHFLSSVFVMLLIMGCVGEKAIAPALTAQPSSTITAPDGSLKSTPSPTAENPLSGSFSEAEIATLASLQQVDDLPFYVMHFVGDYGFDALLGPGERTEILPLAINWGCTTFATLDPEGERLLGRNFDWRVHPALLLFTNPPDGYASVSIVDASYLPFDGEPLDDAERRGLLRAPFLPFDGMNEHGLAVGMMAVPHGEGGVDPRKVTLDSLQVIRLLLDRARTVAEALTLLEDYNVDFSGGPPVHYLIADRGGSAAVVEYIDGQLHVTQDEQPWLVATNFLLDEEKPDGANSSCSRYNHAYETLAAAGGKLTAAQALSLLKEVAQGGDYPTIWSVVYDLKSGEIQVVIRRGFDQVKKFQLARED